jgi:hypothetical protein
MFLIIRHINPKSALRNPKSCSFRPPPSAFTRFSQKDNIPEWGDKMKKEED